MRDGDRVSSRVTGAEKVSFSWGFVGIGPALDRHPWTSGSGKKSVVLQFSWVTLCVIVVHRQS